MDPHREWTAKDDMEALLCCIDKQIGPSPPKVNHEKLSSVQERIRELNQKSKKRIYERPTFPNRRLNRQEWMTLLESYETELEIILQKEDPIPNLVNLEEWFFSFYPCPPQTHSMETLIEWRDRYILFAERRYSDLLPFEYRKEVAEKMTMLNDDWKQNYYRELNKLVETIPIFREVKLVKLTTVKKIVSLK